MTRGFIKVVDDQTLALADFAGNAQYISLGNLSENSKAFMFLMDYPNRQRIKIWGTAEDMTPHVEKYQRCIAELEATNATLREQLIEAGLRPAAGDLATDHPNPGPGRSSDDRGCAPPEL